MTTSRCDQAHRARYGLALIAALLALPAAAAVPVRAPSGHAPELVEVLLDAAAATARFRFVLPRDADGAAPGHAEIAPDFGWICATYAAPALARGGWEARQIVLSFSDREIPFGMVDPDVMQYFEAFRVEGDACLLEPY